MPPAPDPTRHNQLVDVARLYYLDDLTHQQIADRLGLSRVKVTRLLRQAVEAKVVEFRIADPALASLVLEDQLKDAVRSATRRSSSPPGRAKRRRWTHLGASPRPGLANAWPRTSSSAWGGAGR